MTSCKLAQLLLNLYLSPIIQTLADYAIPMLQYGKDVIIMSSQVGMRKST